MMRIGALAAGLKQKDGQPRRRKRTPSEDEVELFKTKEHTEISDIDIRENSKTRLRFRKLPWTELILTGVFWGGALIIFIMMNVYAKRLKGL